MFIILFILSLGIPVLGACGGLAYFGTYKRPVLSALICGAAASAMFYGYIPDVGNDIYRHMENLSLYENIPIYDAFNRLKDYHISGIYTWDIYLWIMAHIGNPYLIQSTAAFLGYFLISFVIFDQAKSKNISFINCLLIYMVGLSAFPLLEIAIGIRSANAFILTIVSFYLYYIKKSSRLLSLILLIIAFFLHSAAVIPVALFILIPLLARYRKMSIMLLILLCIIYYQYQDAFYAAMLSSENAGGAVYTASVYSQGDFNDGVHSIVTLVWRNIFALTCIMVLHRCIKKKMDIVNHRAYEFILVMFILSIGLTIILGNNGLRYVGMVVLLSCILLEYNGFSFFDKKRDNLTLSGFALMIGSFGCYALYLYDMNWGTGSLASFFLSAITGYISRSF